MPVKHSPPARQTRSQARAQAVLTPSPRAPLDCTPVVPQLRAKLDRGPILEGRKRAKKIKVPGEDDEEEEENSVGEEESDGIEGVPAPVGASQGTGGPTLAQSYQPFSHQPPAFKTPECSDGTQPFKVGSFIQSFQLIFHNNLANCSQDRNKFLYATSFLIGRAAKWIEPYLSKLTNQDQSYLLNSWKIFESQLSTLFGDPNEVRKAEAELDSLRMKEGRDCHPGFWINWPPILQELMEITLELDTRYHERQNEKRHHQEKKPEASKSNSFHPQNSSSSSQKKKNFHKRDKPHSSLLNKYFKLINSQNGKKNQGGFMYLLWWEASS
ncbi:hypothetical protein O181_014611 [Austropuccinia psidii MF-1]|uniref:DUF4939 domain-containing protein n=1 Tax=Austropuccinia psidii MF-1 TaxID=1389203 RepID=A0A9Q3GPA4_9BASI|nr:hypothetical protein [Austropuccinia psidii MF-1]